MLFVQLVIVSKSLDTSCASIKISLRAKPLNDEPILANFLSGPSPTPAFNQMYR